MFAAYFDQFNVIRIITVQLFLGERSVTFTNSSMMMVLAVLIFWLLLEGNKLIPDRWQSLVERTYINIRSVVQDNLGKKGQKIFPFVLCLFIFIAMLNILGLFAYIFVPTAQIVITLGISVSSSSCNVVRFLTFKLNFFSILMPGGVPLVLAPFLVVETASYLIKAISLGVRLAANISAGHLLFAILSGFAFDMLANGMIISSLVPALIMVFITLLEIMVAVIQAYVFCLLTTIYFGDTIALH